MAHPFTQVKVEAAHGAQVIMTKGPESCGGNQGWLKMLSATTARREAQSSRRQVTCQSVHNYTMLCTCWISVVMILQKGCLQQGPIHQFVYAQECPASSYS